MAVKISPRTRAAKAPANLGRGREIPGKHPGPTHRPRDRPGSHRGTRPRRGRRAGAGRPAIPKRTAGAKKAPKGTALGRTMPAGEKPEGRARRLTAPPKMDRNPLIHSRTPTRAGGKGQRPRRTAHRLT